MKVLHIIPTLIIGGAEKLLVDTIPIYQAKGIEIEVLVLKKTGSFLEQDLLKNGVKVSFLKEGGSLYNPFYIFKIIPYLKEKDIVHVHLFPTSYWVAFARKISSFKGKLIFTEHSTFNKRRGKFFFRLIESFVYAIYDKIICITEATKNNVINHLLFKKESKFVVVNNGIKVSLFKQHLNNDFSFFDKADFKIIQVSSFRPEKDQQTLLKAMTFLPKHIKLILVGEGKLKSELEQLAIDLGLKERVVFLGGRKDVPELMQYSDAVVLSSNYEGFGIAALEGMACRKPTLASNISGVKEIVGVYGILFEKGNSKDLAAAILKLNTDQNYYNKVAQSCLERAEEFDIVKTVENYLKIYKEK